MKRTVSLMLALVAGSSAWAFDKIQYQAKVDATFALLGAASVDAAKVTALQEDLIRIAKTGIEGYAIPNSSYRALLSFMLQNLAPDAGAVAANLTLSLEEIERDWHECGKPRAQGYDCPKDGNRHFELISSLMDTVIHPATVILLMRAPDAAAVAQAKDELAEVKEHLKHID